MTTLPPMSVIRSLLRLRWWIIGASLVAGIATYLYTLTMPNVYKATINCVPASSDQGMFGGASGLSSALKDIGLSKLTGPKGNTYEFVVVLFARQLRDSMISEFRLAEQYDMVGKPMNEIREAFESDLEVVLRSEGNYEISIWSTDPQKSVTMCNRFVALANTVANNVFRQDASKSLVYLQARLHVIDSVLAALTDSIGNYSKTYLLFSPEDQATASAKAFADARASLLQQQTVLGILEGSYGPDDPQAKAQRSLVDGISKQIDDMTTKPGFFGNFSLKDAAGLGASFMRHAAEFEAYTKLKAFVLPTYEQAKLDQAKNTPSLLVLDTPVPAEKKDRPKRMLITAGATLGTGILFISIVMFVLGWKNMVRKAA